MNFVQKSPYIKSPEYYDKYKCLKGLNLILEGMVSAGKTTLGKAIRSFLTKNGIPTKFYIENINPKLLNLYLGNKEKYAFMFQCIIARERINILKLALEDCKNGYFCIIDRGLLGDYSFAKMQYKKEFFSKDEWDVYENLISMDNFKEPDCTLFLDCTIDIAWERLLTRGNESEIKSYNLEYFKELSDAYNSTIEQFELKNLVKIDWNKSRKIINDELTEETCIEILNVIKTKII